MVRRVESKIGVILSLALLAALLVLNLTASRWRSGGVVDDATAERPFKFCSKCCAGHYGHRGEDPLCCGQEGDGGGLYRLDKVCPRRAPVCRGFEQGIQWGDCFPLCFPLDEGSETVVRSLSRAAVLASAECRPCPTSCCDRAQCSSTREHGDCETHGRFCSGCCRNGSTPGSTILTCDSTNSRHGDSHGALKLPGTQCDLAAGDVNCTACRCDCHLARKHTWRWQSQHAHWRWQPGRDQRHAGGLSQCLNGPHHRPKQPCDPTGIRISDERRVKATLLAEGCDWDVTALQCGGRGLAVPLPFVVNDDGAVNGDETAYRKQGYECFCNAGWRGSRCQLHANGGASRLIRCMADANKTLMLWIGDSQTRNRYVALNRIFNNHIGEVPLDRGGRHRVSVGGLTLRYEWLGTPFENPMPAESGRMGEHDAATTVTVFNSHLWQAAMNRSAYCDLMRRTERALLKRDTYGLRLFVGIEPVNHARLDDGRRSSWQNNSVFRSEESCVNGLFDGYVPMWDTIKDLEAHKMNDGFHHTTEIADAQVVLIIDAVCAALKQDGGDKAKERDAEISNKI